MTLKDINISDKLIKRLSKSIVEGNISHAYIFEGDSCIDKGLLANSFIKAVLCAEDLGIGCDSCSSCLKIEHGNHEDIIYIESEGSSIKDEAIEDMQNKLKKKPYGGMRNIAIIKDADTMTSRAQNRLLKTLEEPNSGTIIILLSENAENLTATVQSRCIIIRLYRDTTVEYDEFDKKVENLSEMILRDKHFFEIKKFLEEEINSKEDAYKLLDRLQGNYRDLLIMNKKDSKLYRKDDIYWAVECIELARRDLNMGIGMMYALKNMIIGIGQRRR